MRRKLVLLALNYPKLNILLLRRTLPELRENHVIPLLEELSGTAKYKATERVFEFPNGSRIKLGYCDAAADVYQYQGQEYDVLGLEEATHFTEEQMRFLTTCNRNTRDDFTPRMYYTCNPGNVGHAWVKRLFIDRNYESGERPEDYAFIPARVFDNKVLMQRDPDYVKTLKALPEEMKRAHLYGDWDVFAGQYFREFSRDKHVVEPFLLPSYYKRFRSMDWGYHDPCCVLWHAVDTSGRIITYRELYVKEHRPEDVAKKVLDMTGDEPIAYTVASPDIWQNRGALLASSGGFEGGSIAELFIKSGMPLLPADNSRISGWQRLRSYMAPGDDFDTRPMWQVFSTCKNLVRTLPALVYDQRDVEDAAQGEDHAPEALRYAIMSRPGRTHLPDVKPHVAYDPLSLDEPRKNGFLGL